MKTLLSLALASLCANVLNAAIRTETVEYKQGDATLEGKLIYDDAVKGARPGVLIVHQWKGVTEHETQHAEMLAQLGYAAFCADIYGKGIRPATPQEAGAEAGKYKKNRPLLRERVNAGLATLRKQKVVDAKHIAAIGYCFGGTTVIELARSGADVAGVSAFTAGWIHPRPPTGRTSFAKCSPATARMTRTSRQRTSRRLRMRCASRVWIGNSSNTAAPSTVSPIAKPMAA